MKPRLSWLFGPAVAAVATVVACGLPTEQGPETNGFGGGSSADSSSSTESDGSTGSGHSTPASSGAMTGPSTTGPGGGSSSSNMTTAMSSTGTGAPVCGDGQMTGSEACDDNNTNPWDGCSQTCQLDDPRNCGGAVGALQYGDSFTVTGDTSASGVNNVLDQGCGGEYANDFIYTVDVAADGKLRATLNTYFEDASVTIMRVCPGGGPSPDCNSCFNGPCPASLDVIAGRYYVVIDGAYGAEGPFNLTISFGP